MSMFTKRRSVGLAVASVLILSAGAYAYWTAGGSGSGSAAAGTTTPLTVNQTTSLTAMYPGDTAQTISGTFDNGNSGSIHVTTVTAAISGVVKDAGAVAGPCTAADFTLANAAMTVNADVAAGSSVGAWTGATIKFNNTGANQDGCKLATVSLSYTIS